MNADYLESVWQYIALAVGGQPRSQLQVEWLAKMILIAEPNLSGWDGVWGVIQYGYEGGLWSEKTLRSFCRHMVLDVPHVESGPRPDCYLWAGGKFRLAPDESPKAIDFQQHWGGEDLPDLNRGIYRIDGDRLVLCFGGSGNPRPGTFNSEDHSDQSVGELVRYAVLATTGLS